MSALHESLSDARRRMVMHQLAERGIADERVLAAMGRIPRERFVPLDVLPDSYADRALPIECEQTISQPYIVALMTTSLELRGDEKVLEIGTGSGYQTAVLSQLAGSVVSVERHPSLSATAGEILASLGCHNVKLIVGNGTLGWLPGAPYDCIIVTAAAEAIPPALFEQLREGGILVMPLGDSESQTLTAVRKIAGQPVARALSGCRFVPLIG
jgi:protein-L-isoaspartate(D-aspartate) O-methyltransferase